MKTVLFIPGYYETISSRNYASTLRAIEKAGYNVEFVDITWKRTTLKDWVAELETVYAKHDPATTVLAGFSYGAMTALLAASHRNPAALWLFSLSPYFADDLSHLKKWWLNEIGKQRVASFQQLDFPAIAGQISCPTIILYGEKEGSKWPRVKVRAEEANRLIKNSYIFEVPDTSHDVADPRYIDCISRAVAQ